MFDAFSNRITLLAIAMAIGTAAPSAADDGSTGMWRNPQNSVHVQAHHCGSSMCGRIVWANDKAKADASRGGTNALAGLELFRDFTQDKRGTWHGKVFVPDINKIFSGTLISIDADTLKGTGCLLGRIGCRSQLWTRIP
ncbi:MAG: DUF2147 domain-containing protein [Janthinobacterium lividum]